MTIHKHHAEHHLQRINLRSRRVIENEVHHEPDYCCDQYNDDEKDTHQSLLALTQWLRSLLFCFQGSNLSGRGKLKIKLI